MCLWIRKTYKFLKMIEGAHCKIQHPMRGAVSKIESELPGHGDLVQYFEHEEIKFLIITNTHVVCW